MPVEPPQTDVAAVMVEPGNALIVTDLFCEPPLEQPPAVTVQFSTTEPLAPAVKVMAAVPLPAVIEPPAIPQV